MSQIHVIAHTHWDQEWYFTRQDSMVLASYNFAEVIETLEQDPAWQCYHLDGQMAVVDDFLAINPDYRPRLEKLVREKSVFVGPWFTQTDTYNVHGESIIRNLKYGIFAARALGHAMQVGYLPDTFGHNAQMPTILQGCNIDNIVFWRGIDHDTQAKNSQFLWRAPSGATIIACAMALGYGAAKNMRAEASHLHGKIYPMVDLLRSRSQIDDLLLPCGGDQVSIDPALPHILQVASAHSPTQDRYVLSSLEQYVALLRTKREQLALWEGELKSPRYTRIHKTIGSVRYDIKKKMPILSSLSCDSWSPPSPWRVIRAFRSCSRLWTPSGRSFCEAMPTTPWAAATAMPLTATFFIDSSRQSSFVTACGIWW